MSGPLFEQYREALRRGHLSTLAGNLEDALEAYREAARLVPERTLALASQGTLLHQLDRWPEAAEVFDAALRNAPEERFPSAAEFQVALNKVSGLRHRSGEWTRAALTWWRSKS